MSDGTLTSELLIVKHNDAMKVRDINIITNFNLNTYCNLK